MSVCIGIVLLLAPVATRSQWTYYDNTSDIRALYQTGDTLWIGTNGGLILYNLLSDKVTAKYSSVDKLPDNSVRTLHRHDNLLYIGTDTGLTVIDLLDSLALAPEHPAGYRNVRSVAHGPEGSMYVGTFGHGVGVTSEEGRRWITRADSLLDNKVYAIAVTDTATMYYATSLGLCAFKDSFWVSYQAGAGIPRAEVRAIEWTGDDRFHILVGGRGVYRFDGTRAHRIPLGETFVEDDVAAIAVDSSGVVWAAGRYGVIAKYENKHWAPVGDEDGEIARTRWRTAYVGPDGTPYFGSSSGLVVAVEPDRLRRIELTSILPSPSIGTIRQDRSGRTFIANGQYMLSRSAGDDRLLVENQIGPFFAVTIAPNGDVWTNTPWGLLRRDNNRWVPVEPEIEPKKPLFMSIAFDELGYLWAGANTGEVYRFGGELWVEYAARGEITMGPIRRIVVDGRRNTWVLADYEGVFRYDGAGWRAMNSDRFDVAAIIDLTSDANRSPVVLTDVSAFWYNEEAGWERLAVPSTADVGRYRTIAFDGHGRTLLGTTDGVAIVTVDSVLWIGAGEGLRGRDVTAMFIDSEDLLWVGFQRDGISRISLENLQ